MAEALRCSQCGASLPTVAPEVASVRCPSCDYVNRIEGELLDQLHVHRRAVADADQAATHAGEFVAVADTSRSFGAGWAWFFVISWLVAGVLAMPETPLMTTLALVVAFAPIVAMMIVAQRRHGRASESVRAGRAVARLVVLHCPTCGGQSELAPSEPVSACRYCGGALAADASEREALLSAAIESRESEARKALIAGWRLAAHGNTEPRTDLVPYFVFGAIGGLLVLGVLAVDVRQLVEFDGELIHGTELLAMNLVALVIAAGVSVPLIVQRRRRLRWRSELEAFAKTCGGQHHAKLGAFADYLADHWYGNWPRAHICAARGFGLIVASGPPHWAVSVTPIAQRDSVAHPHLRVLIPGDADGRRRQAADDGDRRDPLLALRGLRHRVVDRPLRGLERAANQREVALGHRAAVELLAQPAHRIDIEGEEQHAAGRPVEPVDRVDPTTDGVAHPLESVGVVLPGPAAMDRQSRGLGDRHQVLVTPQDRRRRQGRHRHEPAGATFSSSDHVRSEQSGHRPWLSSTSLWWSR